MLDVGFNQVPFGLAGEFWIYGTDGRARIPKPVGLDRHRP